MKNDSDAENKGECAQVLTCLDGADVKDNGTWFEKPGAEILELFNVRSHGRLPDMVMEIKSGWQDLGRGAEICMEGGHADQWKWRPSGEPFSLILLCHPDRTK